MKSVYTVKQVNEYILRMFQNDFLMNRLYIKGEVSNCKYHNTGHIYFSLKDESGKIACVLFAGNRRGLKFKMADGDQVIVLGNIKTYVKNGDYQVYASEILKSGEGELAEQLEALKKRLAEMGMFAQEYKLPIPKYVKTIGVITSKTGDALQDIIEVTRKRNPYIQIVLCPAQVEGAGAAESIVAGIEAMQEYVNPDVIILGRGGGASEGLDAFNDENVAKAIFGCRIPVISAVGHQTNTMIADYVADLRAATPTEAAVAASYEYAVVAHELEERQLRMKRAMERHLLQANKSVERYTLGLRYLHPRNKLQEQQQRLALLEVKFHDTMQYKLEYSKNRLQLYIAKFKGLSPLDKISLGYGYIQDKDGKSVVDAKQLQKEDVIQITMATGTVKAEVVETKGDRVSW